MNEEALKIIRDLYDEFEKEENSLKVQHDNNSSKIEELEENILSLMKNEDIDYKVFSPRSIVSTNKEKIENLRKEKEDAEKSNKSVLKQMRYYSEKTEKLEYLLGLFKSEKDTDIDETELRSVDTNTNINTVNEKSTEKYSDSKDTIDSKEDDVKENVKENIKDIVEQKELSSVKSTVLTSSLQEELERVNHKLELCSKFVDTDSIRTKIEIKDAMRNLSDIILSIKY